MTPNGQKRTILCPLRWFYGFWNRKELREGKGERDKEKRGVEKRGEEGKKRDGGGGEAASCTHHGADGLRPLFSSRAASQTDVTAVLIRPLHIRGAQGK